jgi:hypothetical protein
MYPKYLDVSSTLEGLNPASYTLSSALLFRFPTHPVSNNNAYPLDPDPDPVTPHFDITEIPCSFPLTEAGACAKADTDTGPQTARRALTYTHAAQRPNTVGIVCTHTTASLLNGTGEFFVQYPDLEGFHMIATGIKHVIANTAQFCLITRENKAYVSTRRRARTPGRSERT